MYSTLLPLCCLWLLATAAAHCCSSSAPAQILFYFEGGLFKSPDTYVANDISNQQQYLSNKTIKVDSHDDHHHLSTNYFIYMSFFNWFFDPRWQYAKWAKKEKNPTLAMCVLNAQFITIKNKCLTSLLLFGSPLEKNLLFQYQLFAKNSSP